MENNFETLENLFETIEIEVDSTESTDNQDNNTDNTSGEDSGDNGIDNNIDDAGDADDGDAGTDTNDDAADNQEGNQGNEGDEDTTQVQDLFNTFGQFVTLDKPEDGQEITETFLREQLTQLPERSFLSYVDKRPQMVKDFLTYQAQFENPTQEQLTEFFSQYMTQEESTHDVTTNEGARAFLASHSSFKELYEDDEEGLNDALDRLEDKELLLSRAKKLFDKQEDTKETDRLQAIEDAKEQRRQAKANQAAFTANINKEAEALPWELSQKQAAINNINSETIKTMWGEIIKSPKGLLQFGDILTHFKEGNFDSLYKVLEGKKKSDQAESQKDNINKDSFGKLLGKHKKKEVANLYE